MRPIVYGAKAPITALTTAYATDVTSTGAALTLAANAPTDGLAHLVTFTSAGGVDISAVTFTIVGLDADGNAQTEDLAGSNANTVTGTKYFRYVTSVTPSATMGGKVMKVGIGAVSLSQIIPLEARSIAAAMILVDISGTIDFTVLETSANIWTTQPSTVGWTAITALSGKSADTTGSSTVGATAIQLKVNSVTNGATYTINVKQPTQQTG